MKGPGADVAVERSPFITAYVDGNADAGELVGQGFGNAPSHFLVGGFVDQVQARVALGVRAPACAREEPTGFLRVVGVSGDLGFVGPVVRGEQAGRDPRLVAEQVADDRLSIDGVRDRAAHDAAAQDGMLVVHAEVLVGVVGRAQDLEPGFVGREPCDVVRIDGVLHEVDAAVAQLEDAHDGIGNDPELDAPDSRRSLEVRGGRHQPDGLECLADGLDTVGACARERYIGVVGAGGKAGGQDAEAGRFEERRVDGGEAELDGTIVENLHAFQSAQGCALGAGGFRVEHGPEGRRDVGRRERRPVVEPQARSQAEAPGQRSCRLPTLGEPGLGATVGAGSHQAGMDQAADPGCRGIDAAAGVHRARRSLDGNPENVEIPLRRPRTGRQQSRAGED